MGMPSQQFDYVMSLVKEERAYQDRRWGVQDHSRERWFAILAEEVGEAAKISNDGAPDTQLMRELAQVAAVAVAWMEILAYRGVAR